MSYEPKHVFACLPRMERGVPIVIGGDPKGNNFLYTNGKCVIIRNIENPAIADIYTEHAHQVAVAKYAPSGFYIASGDATGKIRIWDTTQTTHILKYEYTPISGKIKDIAWTEDSKRICTAGEGREKFASVFLWDTGSSVGDILGHSKVVNSVDIRHKRPYRLVTGSDDTSVCFFEGPPFKFKTTIRVGHTDSTSEEHLKSAIEMKRVCVCACFHCDFHIVKASLNSTKAFCKKCDTLLVNSPPERLSSASRLKRRILTTLANHLKDFVSYSCRLVFQFYITESSRLVN